MTRRLLRNFFNRYLIAIVTTVFVAITVAAFFINLIFGFVMLGISLTSLGTLLGYRYYIGKMAKEAS